jgi:hypothetical protein
VGAFQACAFQRGGAMRLQGLSEFVGSIYDTVVDSGACPIMLNRFADLLDATSGAQVGTYDSKTHQATILAPHVDPEELHSFVTDWSAVWRRCDKYPIGAVIVPEMLISERDQNGTEGYKALSVPPGRERMIGTTLLTEGSTSTVVSLSRPYSEGEFDAPQIRLFAALIPHFQRALQLRLRLAALDGPPTNSVEMLFGCHTGYCWSTHGRASSSPTNSPRRCSVPVTVYL